MAPRFRLPLTIAVPAAATVLSLLVVEGAARLGAWATDQPRGMTFDAELGWRPLPNVSKQGGIWGVHRPAVTNSRGWRDLERSDQVPVGKRRVVAIGDSFTFGVDVDDGERFTDVLERQSIDLEVVNLGVAGYGTDQELRVLQLEGPRYAPDVVMLTIFTGNDMSDIRHKSLYSWPKPHYSLEGDRLRLWQADATWGTRLRSASYLVEFAYQRLVNADRQGEIAPEWERVEATQLFARLVSEIRNVASSLGAPLVAVVAYPPGEIEGPLSAASRQIADSLTAAGVLTLDSRALFVGHPDLKPYVGHGVHWNATGHAVVAEALRPIVAQLLAGGRPSASRRPGG